MSSTAKYLILLDAARCPRQPQNLLSRQLSYFNSHLAKGIYAEVSWWRIATFDDLRQHADRVRASHYLDGPNDVDWIARNEILRKHEERLYVDYVENDGEHFWTSPKQEEEDFDKAIPMRLRK